ncbi:MULTISPECIES: GNAT family N-acetyltransferase [unclassified Flavobacterium]|uniref:GNAT family N-acetyltransferase n=1 Tax=unclassified Flavobacterium TaxID=196869 RepID=UPI0012912591|nr:MULTISPECIES: GNAT family N-acetyltransferase [unclassified Flavobacterium]
MITAKRASKDDFESYFFLKSDEENILWSGHSSAPVKERLFDWYIKNINRKDRYFFLFFDEYSSSRSIGYLYLDIIGDFDNIIELGYGVHSDYKGKGYGTQIIKFAKDFAMNDLIFIKHFQAWIASDNIGSIRVVLKNYFQKTDETKYVKFGDGSEKLFEKYMIDIH